MLFVVVGCLYALFSIAAFKLFGALTIGVTFFPPAGLTLAFLHLTPIRRWPIVLAAAAAAEVLVDLSQNQGREIIGFTLANTIEPAVGAILLRRIAPSISLTRWRHAAGFALAALVAGPAVGAAIGATTIQEVFGKPWHRTFGHWWVGDGLGVLVVAPPALLVFATNRLQWSRVADRALTPLKRLIHDWQFLTIALLTIAFAALVVTADRRPWVYLAIPLLSWTAFRFREIGVASLGMILAAFTTAATAHGIGPWSDLPALGAHAELIQQQAFLGASLIGAWMLAIEAGERELSIRAHEVTAIRLAVASERAGHLDELRRERDQIARLQDLTSAVASASSTRHIADAIHSSVGASMGSSDTVIVLIDERRDAIDAVYFGGPQAPPAYTEVNALALSPNQLLHAVAGGEPRFVASTAEQFAPNTRAASLAAQWSFAALAALPLRASAKSIGVLVIAFDRPHEFTPHEQSELSSIAGVTALSVERALLFEGERLARLNSERLQLLAQHLADASEIAQALSAFAAEALELLGADSAALYVSHSLDSGSLEVAQVVQYKGSLPTTLDADLLAQGGGALPIDVATHRSRWAAQLRLVGVATASVAHFGKAGVIVVAAGDQLHNTAPTDAALDAMVRQTRDALTRLELGSLERAARSQAEQLQAGLAELGRAETRSEVGTAVIDFIVPALGAVSALVAVRQRETDSFVMIAQVGFPTGEPTPWDHYAAGNDMPSADAVLRGEPIFVVGRAALRARYPRVADMLIGAGGHCWAGIPLTATGTVVGTIGIGFADEDALDAAQRVRLVALAGQLAEALQRAERFETEHSIAVTLQRALLGRPATSSPLVRISAQYLPGAVALEVGGDFHDTFDLADGCIGLVIGDVVGSGLTAAAAMGQLRSAVRALAHSFGPAELLSRLDRYVAEIEGTYFATATYVVIDPAKRQLRYSTAGHPPPLMRQKDGSTVRLEAARGAPLGVAATPRTEAVAPIVPGCIVVLYTDGLVERRNETIDEGIARLEAALVSHRDDDIDRLCASMIDNALEGTRQRDDIAILCAEFVPDPDEIRFRIEPDPREIAAVRHRLREFLRTAAVSADDTLDILIAVGEAVANAVEHSGSRGIRPIDVRVELRADRIIATIADGGSWREPGAHDDSRGRGLGIMKSLMPEFELSQTATGTVVRLAKTVHRKAILPSAHNSGVALTPAAET